MNIKVVPIQYILEKVCDEFIRKTDGIITIEEKLDFVKKQACCAFVQKNSIVIDSRRAAKNNCKEFPLFNYLHVDFTREWSEDATAPTWISNGIWVIHGFNTFQELHTYVMDVHRSVLAIYVKEKKGYQKVLPIFAFQSPGEKKTYVDEFGFFIIDHPHIGFYRDPNSKYFFEIAGLCEIRRPHETRCYIISSLESLFYKLEEIAFEEVWEGRVYYEYGEIFFNNSIYTYCICVDNGAGAQFYNEQGKCFCLNKYRFCTNNDHCC